MWNIDFVWWTKLIGGCQLANPQSDKKKKEKENKMKKWDKDYNFMTALPEQRNNVTGILVIVINALCDERMHDDVLKTTSRS